jgi:hypothetical protein
MGSWLGVRVRYGRGSMGKIREVAMVDWRWVNGETWHENAVRYFL